MDVNQMCPVMFLELMVVTLKEVMMRTRPYTISTLIARILKACTNREWMILERRKRLKLRRMRKDVDQVDCNERKQSPSLQAIRSVTI